MKLLTKINLVLLSVFLLGLGISAGVARDLLRSNAQAEVIDAARLMMEKAAAVRDYTGEQVAPLLKAQMQSTFLPQSVPSFASAQVLRALNRKYPQYVYRQAMLNPTNPSDRAVDWEADLIAKFKQQPDSSELIGQRDTPTGPALYIARPIRIKNAACLQCHSNASVAPVTLIEKYGPSNGFGWGLDEVLGAQVVSVPVSVALQRADHALFVVVGLLSGAFLFVGLVLNAMLWRLVIQPVTRLSALADRVSMGDMEADEFALARADEIGVLSHSFSRMRRSLVHAMKLLDV